MKIFVVIMAGISSMLAFIFGVSAQMSSSNFTISNDIVGGSGGEGASSDNFKINDTIGETVADNATSSSSNFAEKSGFRQSSGDQNMTFSLSTSTLAFGDLSASSVTTSTHTLTVTTNASNGFSLTVSGNTLTKGSDTISAIGGTAAASSAGTEQFGMNLVANTSPLVGSNASGSAPIGSAANQYNTANFFAFQSGNTVATSSSAINQTTFTASYIANILSSTEGGEYSTTLTYTATPSW